MNIRENLLLSTLLFGLIFISGCASNYETAGISKCGDKKENKRSKCAEFINSYQENDKSVETNLIDLKEILISHSIRKTDTAVNHKLQAKTVVDGVSDIEISIDSEDGETFGFNTKKAKHLSNLEKAISDGVFVSKDGEATLNVSYKYKGKTINHKKVIQKADLTPTTSKDVLSIEGIMEITTIKKLTGNKTSTYSLEIKPMAKDLDDLRNIKIKLSGGISATYYVAHSKYLQDDIKKWESNNFTIKSSEKVELEIKYEIKGFKNGLTMSLN
ncbi:MAG: hypothetical protein K0S51_1180 [Bacillales bacterium]|jgi:hypothetical protein|nr:hypothetical protein [Bacillales bacterium]